ncbi:MAG TPA: NAD+ synthase [Candidatus Dormibacteraeota bacterium]|nr:NAD+ synthase [Candidatus Dormibacteraeota bacterium]
MSPTKAPRVEGRSSRVVRIALAQINPTVGDLPGNAKRVIEFIDRAREMGTDIIAFPELVLTGYPPEDLLLRPDFIDQNQAALEEVTRATQGITAIVGFAQRAEDVYNAAAIAHDGEIAGVCHKIHLPNYSVFDEVRYFRPGRDPFVCKRGPLTFGVNICEDIWLPSNPTLLAVSGEAELVINVSSSPFHMGKSVSRDRMLATRAMDGVSVVAFVNTVGGQDELVFDGNSRVFGPRGDCLARAKAFEEDLVVLDIDLDEVFSARLKDPRSREMSQREDAAAPLRIVTLRPVPLPTRPSIKPRPIETPSGPREICEALILGTRDYVRKNDFTHVLLGLSGGIDSALTASIAVDALGASCVTGVFMPSPFTEQASAEDAEALAKNLGIQLLTLPIAEEMEAYKKTLSPVFSGMPSDATEENIQSRIRGNFLMALSNKFGWLVLTTGNKSEYSVGYTTLYGDMAGGFAVLKDAPKTLVYEIARYRNAAAGPADWIPKRTIEREPTAELRPGQRDTDTLPPYDVLDPILKAYVEEDWEVERIVAMGYDRALVQRVVRMVDRAEYKRRQSPPGIRITPRALGKDRRLPITNRHQSWRD